MAFNIFSGDPTGGLFGNVTRALNLDEHNISEFFGGKTGSVQQAVLEDELGGPLEGPRLASGEFFRDPRFSDVSAGRTFQTGSVPSGDVIGTSTGGGAQISTGRDSGGRQTFFDTASGENRTKKTDEGAIEAARRAEEARRQREVESLFSEGERFLSESEKRLRASEGDLLTSATAPFDQAVPLAEAAIEEGKGRFAEGTAEAGQQEQSLLADARRLGFELTKRNEQRFGGSALSSAAQAASELGGRQLQRSLGQIQQNTANAVNTIKQNLINFENGAQAKIQELELKKNEAVAQANIRFRDSLAAIDAQRVTLATNKAVAKLDALREYRNQLANVDAQATQFAQQIELLREQARLNANNSLAQFSQAAEQAGTSTGAINTALGGSGADIAANITTGNRLNFDQAAGPQLPTGRVGEEEDRSLGGGLLNLA